MAADTDVLRSAVKFICGESEHVCRLCLASTETEEISVHEFVTITTQCYNDKITYQSIFQELGVSVETSLPDVLCLSCATITVNSYIFQKLCEYSQLQWENSLNSINKSISQSVMLNARAVSAYFIVGGKEDIMFTDYNSMVEKSKKKALAKFKKNIRNRLIAIREKKKIPRKIYCPFCPKIFLKLYELEDHKEQIHYPKTINCDLCSKLFSTDKQLQRHKRRHHIEFPCNICGLELPSKHSLTLHMDKHYKNSCPRCDKQFENLRSFKRHIKVCGEKNKFVCDICSKVYSHKQSLQSHLITDHGFGKNLLHCKWCDKKYDTESKLKGHIVKHTRERNFTCEICGGKFVTNPALVYHMRLHTGERPYPCDMCDERFLSATTRLVHKRRVHLGPSHKCDICDAKFVTSNELKNHKRWHNNPRSKLYVPKTDSTQVETDDYATDIIED